MSEADVARALLHLIENSDESDWGDPETIDGDGPVVEEVIDFEEAGVMTTDAGVVISFRDGSEFQISITRSQ